VWGNPNFDPQNPGADRFTFDIDYWVNSDGVVTSRVQVSWSTPECYSPWINFPFVLVSPYASSPGEYRFETGDTFINQSSIYFDGGKDVYLINDPTVPTYTHQTFTLPSSTNCPAGRQNQQQGPYSTLGPGISLGTRFGIEKSDGSRGVLANVPSNTKQIILYQPEANPGTLDGMYEAFVETQLPIYSNGSTSSLYIALVHFIPWGGGGISKATGQSRLNSYVSSVISDPSGTGGSCPCYTEP
jgi:hypothetical protein